jgi:O-antigen/teichoic acid export membrane protein
MELRLASNALSNLLGAAVPALVALATVPLVVSGLGEAGYGLYALVTAIVGYFAIIDINVTAGSVRSIAAYGARHDRECVSETVAFGVMVYAGLGVLGALGLALGAELLATRVFALPRALVGEAVATLRIAALGFLLGQLQSYLHSVPQSLMRFDISGRLEVLFGTVVPLLTVLVLARGYGLFEVILLRVVASAVNCLLLWRAIAGLLPGLAWRAPRATVRRELLGFSAYACLSRFASLSYAYADKLIIGALVGVTGLAYFTVASTMASRVLGLTYRLSGVMFPAASALAASGQFERLDRLYLKASRYVVFINAAALVLVAVFAYPILLYWMNAEFARHGARVLALMALSQFVDSLTSLPSLVNDGMGHPRTSGLFALARAVLGLPLLWLGIAWRGIEGAAWAHLLASSVLTLAFLGWVHGRTVPTALRALALHAYLPSALGVSLIALGAIACRSLLGPGAIDLALLALLTIALLFAYGAVVVVDKDDKCLAWSKVKLLWAARQG